MSIVLNNYLIITYCKLAYCNIYNKLGICIAKA